MERKAEEKDDIKESKEERLLFMYLKEMDELMRKYPEDPNRAGLDEEKLNRLIVELDGNWMAFKKRWHDKLGASKEVLIAGRVKKDKEGIRHLIIKNELTGDKVLDLTIAQKEESLLKSIP